MSLVVIINLVDLFFVNVFSYLGSEVSALKLLHC